MALVWAIFSKMDGGIHFQEGCVHSQHNSNGAAIKELKLHLDNFIIFSFIRRKKSRVSGPFP